MSSQTTENDPKTNAFRKLDNKGQNYSIWALDVVWFCKALSCGPL